MRVPSRLGLLLSIVLLLMPLQAGAYQTTSKSTQSVTMQAESPDPILALVLGLAVPGIGHFYVGETGEGIALLILTALNCLGTFMFCLLLPPLVFDLFLLGFILHFCLVSWSTWGAYRIAMEERYPPGYPLSTSEWAK